MYKLEELNEKEMPELESIAATFGIDTKGADKQALVFQILDAQADIHSKTPSDAQPERRKRQRVSVKNVDRVYTANQTRAKKVDKTMTITKDDSLFANLSKEEQNELTMMDAAAKAAKETAPAEEPAPKKRTTRKTAAEKKAEEEEKKAEKPAKASKSKKTTTKKAEAEEVKSEEDIKVAEDIQPVEAPAPKKRSTRKTVAEKKAEAEAAKEEANENASSEPATKVEMADLFAQAVPEAAAEVPEAMAEVPEAMADAQGTESGDTKTIILNKQVEFVPPTDGTDFIIVEDIAPIETYAPVPIMKEMEQMARQETVDPRNSNKQSKRQASAPAPVEKPQQYEAPYKFDNIIKVTGVLDSVDNYGFLRSSDYNYLPSPDDVYVSPQQVKQFGLKNGDVVEGFVRPPHDGERFFPLTNIVRINGCDPAVVRDRIGFEFLTPLFPDEKFRLCKGHGDSMSSRVVDLFAPIGKGQRALIVAQPKTGKTLLMKDIANSIAANHPDAYLMMLLIDERPEEVTDMARTVNAEVIASTFDAPAENHVKIAGIVLEKAKRMVECGHDVVIFLDSITRLARAYNTVSPASGKVLSGGVDANALHKPKRFFGAARNIENGGSLTIIATALIDTGSKMDEVIFEEFKGTGNMELQLDRSLANKRIFPAVNLVASSTRRDDLLLDQNTLNRMWVLRKHIADMTPIESMNTILKYMNDTRNNEEFLISMNG